MSMRRTVRRALGFLVHNWPLKLAAIVVATLLYAGIVASQDSSTYPGPVPVRATNQPAGTVVTNQLRDVEQIRYIAPADVPRLRADDFRATVDLAGVRPDGNPVAVPVRVTVTDARVTILEVIPPTIQVVLDTSVSRTVPVQVDRGPAPDRIDIGETRVEPAEVTVSGPSTTVSQVVAARVSVSLDPGGLDVDREFEAIPVDESGNPVTGVDVEPRRVHVSIPLFTDQESRTLPVNAVVTGTPAPGFRVASVAVDPLTVLVQGDGEQLTGLTLVDTAPVGLFGATRNVVETVELVLPPGVVALDAEAVTVTVRIQAVTETRTFGAGIALEDRDPGLEYAVVPGRVLLTLFGPVADLDTLAAAPLTVIVDVGDLAPGVHDVRVVPSLPSGVSVAATAPETVRVTVTGPAPPSPSGEAGAPEDGQATVP